MADIPIPPIPPRRAPLIDIMRELEARPRARQSQEFDPVAAMAAERRSQSRQPLPLPPIPPAVAPPRTAGDSAEAGTPLDLSAVAPTIRSRLPEGNPYVAAAIDIAEKYNLPRDVFLSLVHQESRFDPKAKSPRGAFGLAQLMPGTARELGVDPRDPMANLDAGARYLRQQLDRFGSLPLALAAYNAGPQRVIDAGRVVPNIRETQDYVHKIMRNAGMEGYGYAEGGLAALDEKYAEGGTVRAPSFDVREPYESELEFFEKNPNVSGMATEDNKVILNPNSNLSKDERDAVILNERARLAIRNGLVSPPDFDLTPEQSKAFSQIQNGRPYGNMRQIRETIAARILSGDPSALNPTADQMHYAQQLREALKGYAQGGTVRAPKETTIAGQDHRLAYITPEEAALLKARGGSGRMTDYGVRAYDEGPGGQGPGGDPSDNANSMSDPATQDAAGGNTGQGAGPTGAGVSSTSDPGPGPTGPGPTGEGQSEVNTPGQAPGISTEPTTNINIGLEDQANAAAALGALATAPIGFEAIGLRDALDMYEQGKISFAEMVGYGLNNVLGPPGTQIGVNVDPRSQTQTPAYDISIPGLAMGALGMISGIPGLGMLGGRAGTALGNALGIPSVTVEYSPGQFDAPTTATSGGEYLQYGHPGYETLGLSNIAAPMARGGMASLEQMHAKYAEGGPVVSVYDPDEINDLANQILEGAYV